MEDITIDDTGDLVITNGDFVIRNSDAQSVVLIVNTMAGQWKQFPTCGVGIIQYSGSSGQISGLRRSITIQLEDDGFKNVEVKVSQNGTDIEYSVIADR